MKEKMTMTATRNRVVWLLVAAALALTFTVTPGATGVDQADANHTGDWLVAYDNPDEKFDGRKFVHWWFAGQHNEDAWVRVVPGVNNCDHGYAAGIEVYDDDWWDPTDSKTWRTVEQQYVDCWSIIEFGAFGLNDGHKHRLWVREREAPDMFQSTAHVTLWRRA